MFHLSLRKIRPIMPISAPPSGSLLPGLIREVLLATGLTCVAVQRNALNWSICASLIDQKSPVSLSGTSQQQWIRCGACLTRCVNGRSVPLPNPFTRVRARCFWKAHIVVECFQLFEISEIFNCLPIQRSITIQFHFKRNQLRISSRVSIERLPVLICALLYATVLAARNSAPRHVFGIAKALEPCTACSLIHLFVYQRL